MDGCWGCFLRGKLHGGTGNSSTGQTYCGGYETMHHGNIFPVALPSRRLPVCWFGEKQAL